MTEINIYTLFKDDRWRILLRHQDGREEVSEQSWATREECDTAIKQYAKELGAKLSRVQ